MAGTSSLQSCATAGLPRAQTDESLEDESEVLNATISPINTWFCPTWVTQGRGFPWWQLQGRLEQHWWISAPGLRTQKHMLPQNQGEINSTGLHDHALCFAATSHQDSRAGNNRENTPCEGNDMGELTDKRVLKCWYPACLVRQHMNATAQMRCLQVGWWEQQHVVLCAVPPVLYPQTQNASQLGTSMSSHAGCQRVQGISQRPPWVISPWVALLQATILIVTCSLLGISCRFNTRFNTYPRKYNPNKMKTTNYKTKYLFHQPWNFSAPNDNKIDSIYLKTVV